MTKVSGKTHSPNQLNNYANQNNPNSSEFKANSDNHSNQMNLNNSRYSK